MPRILAGESACWQANEREWGTQMHLASRACWDVWDARTCSSGLHSLTVQVPRAVGLKELSSWKQERPQTGAQLRSECCCHCTHKKNRVACFTLPSVATPSRLEATHAMSATPVSH